MPLALMQSCALFKHRFNVQPCSWFYLGSQWEYSKKCYGEWVHSQGKQLCLSFLPPFSIGFNSYRKEFGPLGASFFQLKLDPILEGLYHPGKPAEYFENCSPL